MWYIRWWSAAKSDRISIKVNLDINSRFYVWDASSLYILLTCSIRALNLARYNLCCTSWFLFCLSPQVSSNGTTQVMQYILLILSSVQGDFNRKLTILSTWLYQVRLKTSFVNRRMTLRDTYGRSTWATAVVVTKRWKATFFSSLLQLLILSLHKFLNQIDFNGRSGC